MTQPGKVFVSHASADKPFVDRLVADLAARSIPVWYDKLDLKLGESIPGAINAGLSDSKYFAIVLSKASVASKWVQEELNAALMMQVAQGGTFMLPLMLEDCNVPPLLAHRKHADFRTDYDSALNELVSLWGRDAEVCKTHDKETVHPWPDVEMGDQEFIYLHSARFDKFFRASCSLNWSVRQTIRYLIDTLSLPTNVDVASVGMRWSFNYSLRLNGQALPTRTTLIEAGITAGSVVQLGISGLYEDLYKKELKEAFSGEKVYLMTLELIRREQWLREQVAARRSITQAALAQIANSCLSHV